jgi:hypothetical protein
MNLLVIAENRSASDSQSLTPVTAQISNVSDQNDHYIYTLEQCSMCWNRKSKKTVSHTAVGIVQEALKWQCGGHKFKIR